MAKKPKGVPDYEVGYGKPPQHTQFQKGQSGNPSGKSKKSTSIESELKKLLKNEVIVTLGGEQVAMTNCQAIGHVLVTKAKKGDLASIKYVLEKTGADLSDVPTSQAYTLTEADLQAMNSHAKWLAVIEEAQATQSHEEDQGGDDDPS